MHVKYIYVTICVCTYTLPCAMQPKGCVGLCSVWCCSECGAWCLSQPPWLSIQDVALADLQHELPLSLPFL